ncbi:hypothetical protein HDU86_006195 [Geranomyces michiganensis]|nr:hypothetical protein HDU86_006195 [Geranomyces michiganensis]
MSDALSVTSNAQETHARKRKYPFSSAPPDASSVENNPLQARALERNRPVIPTTAIPPSANTGRPERPSKHSALPSSSASNQPAALKDAIKYRSTKQKQPKDPDSAPQSTALRAAAAADLAFLKHIFDDINADRDTNLKALANDSRILAASNAKNIFAALSQCWRQLRSRPFLTKHQEDSCTNRFFNSLPISPFLPPRERSIIRCVFFLHCVVPAPPDCTLLGVVMTDIRAYLRNTNTTGNKGTLNHTCRVVRAFVAWSRFIRDALGVRDLCYDLVARTGATVESLYILDTVDKIWDEPLRKVCEAQNDAARALRKTVATAYVSATEEERQLLHGSVIERLRGA